MKTKLDRSVYIVCLGTAMTQFANMVYPMLTIILQQKMGFSAKAIAVVLAIDSVALFLASFVGGKIADRFNKKMNIIVGDLISILLYITGAILPFSVATIALIIAGGFFQQMELASYNTLIAELTSDEERDRGFSLFYLCVNIGIFASTALSGFLIENHMRLVFSLNALGITISTLFIGFLLKYTPKTHRDEEGEEEKHTVLSVFKQTPVLIWFLLMSCIFEGIHNEYSYLVPMEIDRVVTNGGTQIYGTLVSFSCLCVIALTTLITNLLHKYSNTVKLQLGNIFQMLGFGVFFAGVLLHMIPLFYAGFLLYIVGEICNSVSYEPYMVQLSPESCLGSMYGFFSIMLRAFCLVFNGLIGIAYDMDPNYAWGVMAVACILAMVFCSMMKTGKGKRTVSTES